MNKTLSIVLKTALPKINYQPYLMTFRGTQIYAESRRIWRNRSNLFKFPQRKSFLFQSRSYAEKEDAQVAEIIKKAKDVIDEKMVKDTQAVYQFNIKDHGTYHIDLKNGSGNAGPGEPSTKPDAVLTVDLKNFLDLFSGKLKPKLAVMMGKLKVSGSTVEALKLEKLLPKFRGEPK